MSAVTVPIWVLVALAVGAAALVVFLALGARKATPYLKLGEMADVEHMLPSIAGLTHGAVCDGNAVTILQNGDGFFPVLIDDIEGATESIHLETFVWGKGEI